MTNKNKEDVIAYVRKQREKYQERNRQYVQNYKLSKGCSVCGYNKCATALEFHHNGNKEFGIARMVAGTWGLKKIKEEMDRCDLLCVNCHRELHDKKILTIC